VGKDYRVGLIAGLVLVIAAMIWVATRPSLSPQARLLRPATASSQEERSSAQAASPTPRENLPPGLIPTGPEPSRMVSTTPPLPSLDSIRTQPPIVSQPDAPDLTIYEQKEKIQTTKFHIVRKDETLSSISQQHYGTATKWQKILQANQDTIKDANKITPGTKLIIPD
jgi:nucleoid-associated protein YgaU